MDKEHFMIMHAEVFIRKDDDIEFLLLKRVPEDGGFWQPVTGTIEIDESPEDCLIREINEETGISEFVEVSKELERVDWESETVAGTDIVFAVEVPRGTQVTLSPEHDAFAWLPLEKAVKKLKYEGNKQSMRNVYELITTYQTEIKHT